MPGGMLTLVAKGDGTIPSLPAMPSITAEFISALIYSKEILTFKNLAHLKDVDETNLPELPEGLFWYRNITQWTMRKFDDAPEVVIDLDIYMR